MALQSVKRWGVSLSVVLLGVYCMYVEVFKDMRSGILLMFSGSVLITAILLAFIVYSVQVFKSTEIYLLDPTIRSPLIATLVVSGIGLGIVIYGLFVKFLPSIRRLASLDEYYTPVLILLKIGYYPSMSLIVLGYMIATTAIVYEPEVSSTEFVAQSMLVSWIFIVLSGVFAIIAIAGLIVLCFKLSSKEGVEQYKTAGKLFILSLILLVISALVTYVQVVFHVVVIIAWILLYKALGVSIRKHS